MIEYVDATQPASSTANDTAAFSHMLSSRNEREHSSVAPLQDDSLSPSSVFSTANNRSYPSPWSFFGNDSDVQESVVGIGGLPGSRSVSLRSCEGTGAIHQATVYDLNPKTFKY